jgi:hypothetical protein
MGLALTIVLLLVFATNRIDKKHFNTIQNAVTTLHTDRVVAQDFIYRMNTIVYQKHLDLLDKSPVNYTLNKEFYTLLENFAETKLTFKEAKIFKKVEADFEKLMLKEKKVSEGLQDKKFVIKSLNIIKEDLISVWSVSTLIPK